MAKIIDETCRKCWGAGTVIGPLGNPEIMRQLCDRCKGTGDEPDQFSWPPILIAIVILIVGLIAVWSIPR